MPRIYGTPSPRALASIKTRGDFDRALRHHDEKMLLGLGGDPDGFATDSGAGLLGFSSLVPGIQTNRFVGYSDYLHAGAKKVWASMRAIDLVANVITATELKLTWRDAAKQREPAPVKVDPELLRLLQNPNPCDTISELLFLWVAHLKLTGNAFWLKDEMNGLHQPKHLYALNPRFMRIVPDRDHRIARYVYRVNSAEIAFLPEEIIHFRRPHPVDPLWGLGEIESGESLYDDHINRTLHHARLMANGAFPTSILVKETEDDNQAEWDALQAKFDAKYGGVKNAGKVAWMTGKWSLLQLGLDAQKMQELERGKQNITEIFLNHGVLLSVAGYGSANYATARQEDLAFRRYTCLPLLNLFADVMNSDRGFVRAFTPDHKLDFSLSGLVDVEQVMKDFTPLLDRGGLTPNQLRELAGLPRVKHPLLDQYFVADTLVPIEIAGVASPTEADLSAARAQPKPAAEPDASTNDDTAAGEPPKRSVVA